MIGISVDGPIYVEREGEKVAMRFGDVELVFPPELAYRIGEALLLTSHAMMTGKATGKAAVTESRPRLEVLRGGKHDG